MALIFHTTLAREQLVMLYENFKLCMWRLRPRSLKGVGGLRTAGRYDRTMLGIFPVGDLTEIVQADARADAVILEEPEHCAP